MSDDKRAYRKRRFTARPGQVVRLTGQRFGYLTVISRAGRIGKGAAWLCRCDCGAERVVAGIRLRRNRVKSCNTNGHRFVSPRSPTLRQQYASELISWKKMHERCSDPSHERFPHYGGRGIKVCERWASFPDFMLDMGKKPDPKFTIERDDVNRDYEPGNCKWVPRADQARNRTNTVTVTYQGKRVKLVDLIAELGLSRSIVYQRLKLGWPLDVAIALPVRHYRK